MKQLPKTIDFERFGGGQARLCAVAFDDISDQDIDAIVRICNQPLVKKWVTFQYATGEDGEYTVDDARSFVHRASKNWQNNHFSYLIRDYNHKIVGCMGIKNEDGWMEIGYWSDENHSGYMTNSATALMSSAQQNGIEEIIGLVMPENYKSQNLLKRIGFIEQSKHVKKDGRELIKFVKKL